MAYDLAQCPICRHYIKYNFGRGKINSRVRSQVDTKLHLIYWTNHWQSGRGNQDISQKGRWAQILISEVNETTSKHNGVNFYITQLLTGHVCFQEFISLALDWINFKIELKINYNLKKVAKATKTLDVRGAVSMIWYCVTKIGKC